MDRPWPDRPQQRCGFRTRIAAPPKDMGQRHRLDTSGVTGRRLRQCVPIRQAEGQCLVVLRGVGCLPYIVGPWTRGFRSGAEPAGRAEPPVKVALARAVERSRAPARCPAEPGTNPSGTATARSSAEENGGETSIWSRQGKNLSRLLPGPDRGGGGAGAARLATSRFSTRTLSATTKCTWPAKSVCGLSMSIAGNRLRVGASSRNTSTSARSNSAPAAAPTAPPANTNTPASAARCCR